MGNNKLIAAGLIGIVLVFLIGAFIIVPATGNISADISNSTDNNSNTDSSEDWLVFDNSTPETLAISIARLYCGQGGFAKDIEDTFNASLTSDGKYWIVEDMQTKGFDDGLRVMVDVKTGMSKENNGSWRSLDDLKAQYIAGLQTIGEESIGKPYKITLDGKEIWKVPVYYPVINASDQYTGDMELVGYVYVDIANGKSKKEGDIFDFMINLFQGNLDGWLTLKELDKQIDPMNGFRDALRNLYAE